MKKANSLIFEEATFFGIFRPVFFIWLAMRLLMSVSAALFSSVYPFTDLEKEIAVWPPVADMGAFLNRVFLAPWLRWDADWYFKLLTRGYSVQDGTTSFHPLYILISKPLYWLGFDPLFSLLITSSLFSLGFFCAFYQLARLDLSPQKSRIALLLLASFPVSFILFAPYTESVFLFFSTLALYQMRKRYWLLAALSTCLAALTRQQGVFLIVPMLWFAWEDSGKSIKGLAQGWKGWLAALSAPTGLLIWSFYRILVLQDGRLDLHSWQNFIYSAFLSPAARKILPDQELIWPWNAFATALSKLIHQLEIRDVMTISTGVGFVVLFVLAYRYLRPAEYLYSLVIIFVSFSMSTGIHHIYAGLPRHLFLAIPVFIGLANSLKKRWQQTLLIGFQFLLQIFILYLYVAHAWMP